MPATKTLHVELDRDLAEAVESTAAQSGRTIDNLVESALREYGKKERRARLRNAFVQIAAAPAEENDVDFAFAAQSEVALAQD